jgi:hypothetical protein
MLTLEEALALAAGGYYIPCSNGNITYIGWEEK